MKTLFLLRHAKSSWDDPELADHDRPLKKRGIKAAKSIARWMIDQQCLPERVLCSSAVRARETWRLVRETWEQAGLPIPESTVLSELYHCEPCQFRESLSPVERHVISVLIVGHNPGLEEWLAELTRQPEHLPTAALAHVELPIDEWEEIRAASLQARLVHLIRPRELSN